jgi:hypothetical protein
MIVLVLTNNLNHITIKEQNLQTKVKQMHYRLTLSDEPLPDIDIKIHQSGNFAIVYTENPDCIKDCQDLPTFWGIERQSNGVIWICPPIECIAIKILAETLARKWEDRGCTVKRFASRPHTIGSDEVESFIG